MPSSFFSLQSRISVYVELAPGALSTQLGAGGVVAKAVVDLVLCLLDFVEFPFYESRIGMWVPKNFLFLESKQLVGCNC